MSLARVSWIIVVAICALATLLLEIGGYTGYGIVVGAVGLAAAVNLLPQYTPKPLRNPGGHPQAAAGPPGSGPPPGDPGDDEGASEKRPPNPP